VASEAAPMVELVIGSGEVERQKEGLFSTPGGTAFVAIAGIMSVAISVAAFLWATGRVNNPNAFPDFEGEDLYGKEVKLKVPTSFNSTFSKDGPSVVMSTMSGNEESSEYVPKSFQLSSFDDEYGYSEATSSFGSGRTSESSGSAFEMGRFPTDSEVDDGFSVCDDSI